MLEWHSTIWSNWMTIQTPQFTFSREPLAAAWGGEILDKLLSRPTVGRTEEGSVSPPRPPSFPRKTRPRQQAGEPVPVIWRSHCCHSKLGFTAAHWGKPKILGYLGGRWIYPQPGGLISVQMVGQHQGEALDTKLPAHSALHPPLHSQTWDVGLDDAQNAKDETGNAENYTLCVANSGLGQNFPPIQK